LRWFYTLPEHILVPYLFPSSLFSPPFSHLSKTGFVLCFSGSERLLFESSLFFSFRLRGTPRSRFTCSLLNRPRVSPPSLLFVVRDYPLFYYGEPPTYGFFLVDDHSGLFFLPPFWINPFFQSPHRATVFDHWSHPSGPFFSASAGWAFFVENWSNPPSPPTSSRQTFPLATCLPPC